MQVIVVQNPEKGIERAKEELYKIVDNKTVLFLSGGNTPKPLYENLANEGVIKPAAAALIDERFGEKMHETSNERMIKETGFFKYLTMLDIPFYPILQKEVRSKEQEVREETAEKYDEMVRKLFFHVPRSVGIMGIGADGHTAGIPASGISNFQFPISNKHQFVDSYHDKSGKYGERITLTFAGLGLIDHFIVLVFGKDKAKALHQTFEQGPLEEIPARFYLSDEQSKKTLLITDQKI